MINTKPKPAQQPSVPQRKKHCKRKDLRRQNLKINPPKWSVHLQRPTPTSEKLSDWAEAS